MSAKFSMCMTHLRDTLSIGADFGEGTMIQIVPQGDECCLSCRSG